MTDTDKTPKSGKKGPDVGNADPATELRNTDALQPTTREKGFDPAKVKNEFDRKSMTRVHGEGYEREKAPGAIKRSKKSPNHEDRIKGAGGRVIIIPAKKDQDGNALKGQGCNVVRELAGKQQVIEENGECKAKLTDL